MHNRIGFSRLGRKASHRKALHKNMATSLFLRGKIKTTGAKAREVRRSVEKLITRAREDSVHNRRIVSKVITDKAVLNKLFVEVAPTYRGRPGGYTRLLKLGRRQGDAAEMVLLELVDRKEEEVPPQKRGKGKGVPKETGKS